MVLKKHLNLVPIVNKYPKLAQQYPIFSYTTKYGKIIPSSFSGNYPKTIQQYPKLYEFILLHIQHRIKIEK